ncbi:MAG: hypothetical protein QOH49_1261 [Acidobacteriota bacterium]|jgi:hypothetical protein|nr:hypothetical protein [Acidobacteriota bacterium]
MCWLSSPKVRLALIVNGLYFISLFTPTQRHDRPHLFAHMREPLPERAAPRRMPIFALLPPPSGPSQATTNVMKGFDQLDVYLTNDLTLVRRPGHRLLLSPTFTTRASNPQAPDTVLLRFVSYSDEQTFSDTSPFIISADGVSKVDATAGDWYSGSAARHSVAEGDDGEVIETVGVELPYEIFFETISARKVIIQLGHDRVELTAEQIEALRDMHRRLPQPPQDSASH